MRSPHTIRRGAALLGSMLALLSSLTVLPRPVAAAPPGPLAWERMKALGGDPLRATRSPDIDAPNPPEMQPPKLGTNRLIVLLVDFKNHAGTKTDDDFESLLFTGANSMADYYEEVSYNQFSVTGDVYPNTGWYRVAQNDSYYIDGDGGMRVYPKNSQGLVKEAVALADADVNFANYDNDQDGYVDTVIVVFAGNSAAWDGESDTEFWPHHWRLSSGSGPGAQLVDGVYVDDYFIAQELEFDSSTTLAGIGIFCHEYGHVLGLPDLYDTVWSNYVSTYDRNWGLGVYDLMAYGSWGADWSTPTKPTHLSAWSKMELGWLTPTDVAGPLPAEQIQPIETTPDAYRLWTYGHPTTEYFLVENREQTGFDSQLPGCGLLIYHVDLAVKSGDFTGGAGNNWSENNLQWDECHKFIDLECANQSGADHARNTDTLDVCGTGTNPCGSTNIYWRNMTDANFNNNSVPSSKGYGGVNSQVTVQNISGCPTNMTADLSVGQPPAPDVRLWIKDCPADTGVEPSSNLCPEWWTSDDIWIDNNSDGTEDRPVENADNRLYVRVRNLGTTAATNVQLSFYYRNNSTGLEFPGQAPNLATLIGTRDVSLLPAGGSTTRWLTWHIPPAPANGHYCIGVVARCADDIPASMGPANTANIGCVNLIQLYARTGGKGGGTGCGGTLEPVVANFDMENPTSLMKTCRLQPAATTPTGWLVEFEDLITHQIWQPPQPHIVTIPPHGLYPIRMRVTPMNASHGSEAKVVVTQYDAPYYPNPEGIMGGLTYVITVDCYAPQAIHDLVATVVTEDPGTMPDPPPGLWPGVRLDFSPVLLDVNGGSERVAYYNVYRATTPNVAPLPGNLIARLTGDADPGAAKWQYYDLGLDVGPWYDRRTEYYYLLGAVDAAGYESGYSYVAGTGRVVDNGTLSATLHEFGGCGQRLPYDTGYPADITWRPIAAAPQIYSWEGNLRYDEGSGPVNHLLSPAGPWEVREAAHYLGGQVWSRFGNACFDIRARHELAGAELLTTLEIRNTCTATFNQVRLAWLVDGDLTRPDGDPQTPCCIDYPWIGYGFGRWFGAAGGGLQANRNTCAGIVPPTVSVMHTARLDGSILPDAWTVSNPSGFSGAACSFSVPQTAEHRWLGELAFDNTAGCAGFDQDLAMVTAFTVPVWPPGVTHTFTYTLTFRRPGDADANGTIDVDDFIALATGDWLTGPAVNGAVTFESVTFDYDCDDDVDLADMQALQRVFTGD